MLHIYNEKISLVTLFGAWLLLLISTYAHPKERVHVFMNPKKDMMPVFFYDDYLKESGEGYFLVDTGINKTYSNVKFYTESGVRYFCVANELFKFIGDINRKSDGDCITIPSKSNKHRWAHSYDPKIRKLTIYIPDETLRMSKFDIEDFSYGDSAAKIGYKIYANKESNENFYLGSRYDLNLNVKEKKLIMKGESIRSKNTLDYLYLREDVDSLRSKLQVGYEYLYNESVSDNFYGVSLKTNNELKNSFHNEELDYFYGTATVDSTVKIFIGEELIKEKRVLSGDFSILKPLVSSNENFRVVIEGDDGNNESFIISNSGLSKLQPYRYNVTLGVFKDNKDAFLYFDNITSLNQNFNLGFKSLMSENNGLLGLSSSLNYHKLRMNYKLDTVFRDGGHYSISNYGVNYIDSNNVLNIGGNISFKNHESKIKYNYNDRAYIYIAKSLYNNSYLKLDYNYELKSNNRSYSAVFSTYILNGDARLSLGGRFDFKNDDQFFASIRIPIGSGSLTSRYRIEPGLNYFDNDYQFRYDNTRYSLGSTSNRDKLYDSGRFSINHYSDKADFNFRYNDFNNKNKFYSDMTGFAIYDGEDIYLNSKNIKTGYVFSGLESLEVNGVPLGEDSYYVGSSSPFRDTKITIRDRSLFSRPYSYESIKLRDGSVKIIKKETEKKHFDYIFIIKSGDNYMYSNAELYDISGNYISKVKRRGIVNFISDKPNLTLIVKWGDNECKIGPVYPYSGSLMIFKCER